MNKLSPLFSAVAIASLGMTGLGLGVSSPAYAELIVSSSSTPKAPRPASPQAPLPAAQPASGSVSPESVSSESASLSSSAPGYLPSWGYNVPLGSAVFQIIPAGYAVKFDPSVNLKQIVSWQGGVAWQSALIGMLSAHDLVAVINPRDHQINVSHRSATVPVTTTVTSSVAGLPVSAPSSKAPLASAPRSSASSLPASSPVPPPPPAVAPSHTWILNPGLSLKQNVIDWAKQAGWHVEWSAVDYPVVAKVVFHGAFDADNGPIATIIQAYKQASQPLTAHLTTMDHVVYVENTTFQPQVVLPISGNPKAAALFHDNSVYGPRFNTSSGDPDQPSISTPDAPNPPLVPSASVTEHFSAPPAGFSVSTGGSALKPISATPASTPAVIAPQSLTPPTNQLAPLSTTSPGTKHQAPNINR